MTFENPGEMLKEYSACMYIGKSPLISMGAERRVSFVQTREQGTPSARAELIINNEN